MQASSISELTKGDCEEVRDIYGILARFAIFRRAGGCLVDVVPGLESFLL